MASIGQHNTLLKCMMGGQSHFRHILTNDHVHQMTMIEKRYPVSRLPVCEHCEGLAMWSKNAQGEPLAICRKCGTITVNPITLSEYYVNGYDMDKTANARDIFKQEINARDIILGKD